MSKISTKFLTPFLGAVLLFNSCKKDATVPAPTSTKSTTVEADLPVKYAETGILVLNDISAFSPLTTTAQNTLMMQFRLNDEYPTKSNGQFFGKVDENGPIVLEFRPHGKPQRTDVCYATNPAYAWAEFFKQDTSKAPTGFKDRPGALPRYEPVDIYAYRFDGEPLGISTPKNKLNEKTNRQALQFLVQIGSIIVEDTFRGKNPFLDFSPVKIRVSLGKEIKTIQRDTIYTISNKAPISTPTM